jgi:CAAX protease family protein
MYDRDSKGISFIAGFFMLIAFTVAGVIIASIISIPVWTNMTGKSILDMEKYMTEPGYSNAIKIIQSITAIVGFLIPSVFTAFLLNRRPFRLLGFSGTIRWKQISLVAGIVVIALIVSGALSYFNEQVPVSSSMRLRFDQLEREYMQQVKAIVSLNNTGQFIVSLFVMAFLPALCEEALFRGGLQNFLTRSVHRPWLSILLVSIIFSLSHFSFYGFLSRMFLGIILGFIYHYSGKLWLSVLAHFLNNAIAISLLFAFKMQGKPLEDAMGDTGGGGYWGLLLIPVLIILLKLFKKINPKPAHEPVNPEREELRNTPFY